MKKLIVVMMFLVAGFVFISPAMAIICIPHQVKPGETVESLCQHYTGDYSEKLIIRKDKAGRTAYLSSQNQLVPGETVYVAKSKVATNTVRNSSTLVASTFKKEEKTIEGKLPGLEKNLVAQKSPDPPLQPKQPTPPTETAPVPEKVSTQKELGLKTDFGKGLRNWNASVGYTLQEDYDAGHEDKAKRSGESFYAKGHFFPWEWKTEERTWKIGPEGKIFWGESNVNRDTYDYKGVELGLKTESKKDHQTIGFSGGLGFQETSKEGSSKGQESLMAYFGASWEDKQREAMGKMLFPEYYLSARYNHMLEGNTEGGASKYDESTLEFRQRLDLVNLPLGESLLLTPNLNALEGYSWGKESIFLGGGPGLKFGDTDGNNFVETRFWNPKIFLDNPGASTMETFSITINIDDTFRAFRAEGVKEYKPGNGGTKPVSRKEAEEYWP